MTGHLQFQCRLEDSGGEEFIPSILENFIHGSENSPRLQESLDIYCVFDTLSRWTDENWLSLLSKSVLPLYIRQGGINSLQINFRLVSSSPPVVIRGRPSSALARDLEIQEKIRLEKRASILGHEGLMKKQTALDRAVSQNTSSIPIDVLKSLSVPEECSISWIPVQTAKVNEMLRHDYTSLPISFHHTKVSCLSLDTAYISALMT